jgi:hypothetical protein
MIAFARHLAQSRREFILDDGSWDDLIVPLDPVPALLLAVYIRSWMRFKTNSQAVKQLLLPPNHCSANCYQ